MNTHVNKNREKPEFERRYKGVTVTAQNYRELMEAAEKAGFNPRHEINYHTRHLEAYLKGKKSFKHGWRYDEEGRITGPAIFQVQEEWVKVD